MFKFLVLSCFLYFCATPLSVRAMSPEQKAQIHAHFESIGKICFKDITITEDDMNNLKNRKIPSGENVPCFLACMMKHIGVMDDNGILQKETALEMAKSVFEDPEEIKNIEDYLHSCAHVNTMAVSDGEKGCERAMLSYKCMIENASQFGFDI